MVQDNKTMSRAMDRTLADVSCTSDDVLNSALPKDSSGKCAETFREYTERA